MSAACLCKCSTALVYCPWQPQLLSSRTQSLPEPLRPGSNRSLPGSLYLALCRPWYNDVQRRQPGWCCNEPQEGLAVQAIDEECLTAVAVRLHDKKAAVCKEAASGLLSIFRWPLCLFCSRITGKPPNMQMHRFWTHAGPQPADLFQLLPAGPIASAAMTLKQGCIRRPAQQISCSVACCSQRASAAFWACITMQRAGAGATRG